MELKGEYRIPAPRERVWALLNDPAVLRECIPGCDSLEATPDGGFAAQVTTKIGPVKATFQGAVVLSNVSAPSGYTISGEGKGGVAGFAKGGADVHLAEDGAGTVLTYVANAQVGGKLAQLGSRLIDSTARKLADQFFACFARKAGAASDDLSAGAATEPGPAFMPGEPIPPMATGVPIVNGAAADAPMTAAELPGAAMERPTVGVAPTHHGTAAAAVPPATAETNAPGHSIQAAAHEVEDELERKAAVGFLGGPVAWGFLALLVVVVLIYVWT